MPTDGSSPRLNGADHQHKAEVARSASEDAARRVLVVDDEEAVLGVMQMALSRSGYEVASTSDARTAVELAAEGRYHVVVSDVNMPGMDGIRALRAIREHDPDVQVILVTGAPSVQTAMRAVQFGAIRYLTKPVRVDELRAAVAHAARVRDLAVLKREALSLAQTRSAQQEEREASFKRALDTLWIAYQPVVSLTERRIYGHESLLRSSEPAFPNPGVFLRAAEDLDRVQELGRCVRDRVAKAIPDLPENELVFVNLHPLELHDNALYASSAPLSQHAHRVILEVTERSRLRGGSGLGDKLATLRDMGFRIAVDDLGTGFAGLTSFVQLEPELVKIDMSLIRNIDHDPKKQRLVYSMLGLCKDMGIEAIAEGVETTPEAQKLAALGADLLQGYAFARPSASFVALGSDAFACFA